MKESVVIQKKYIPITEWAEDDRPREKLRDKGVHALSDAELIAILLATGTGGESAVDLGKKMMKEFGSLHELGKFGYKNLTKIKGIGEAKAITIIAALELGRRRQLSEFVEKPSITSSRDAFQLLRPYLMDLSHEEFWLLFLNRANMVIGRECISKGGMAGTVVDPKMVFIQALERKAHAIILAHNHPSGNLRPSQQDLDITKKLKEAGKVLEISVLDHLIITDKSYYSFNDEGVM